MIKRMKKIGCYAALSTLAILVISSSVSFAQVPDVQGTYSCRLRIKFYNIDFTDAPGSTSFTENATMRINQSGTAIRMVITGLTNNLLTCITGSFFHGEGSVSCCTSPPRLIANDCDQNNIWGSSIVANRITSKKIKGTWQITDNDIGDGCNEKSGLVIKFTAKRIDTDVPLISPCP